MGVVSILLSVDVYMVSSTNRKRVATEDSLAEEDSDVLVETVKKKRYVWLPEYTITADQK